MSRFAIRTPYLIIVACLMIVVLGASSTARMPVDMFPAMNIPVVEVATFYSGMPPEQVESNITYHLERFFTLASGVDHIESRSLNGVSIIKVFFQSDTDADTDAAKIANLAISDMRDLPPGTFPPIVLKSDASSLPVCLVTVSGQGMGRFETERYCPELRSQPACVCTWRICAAALSAVLGGRSSFMSILTKWRRVSSVPWTWCAP